MNRSSYVSRFVPFESSYQSGPEKEKLPPQPKRRKEAEASVSGLQSEEEVPSRGRYTLEERLDFLTEAVFDIRRRMDVETKERAVEDDAPSKGT